MSVIWEEGSWKVASSLPSASTKRPSGVVEDDKLEEELEVELEVELEEEVLVFLRDGFVCLEVEEDKVFRLDPLCDMF